MAEITKRATFYAGKRRRPKMFHIETDGAVINITVGLSDGQGRQVTAVSIIPDDEARGGDGLGRMWRREGDRIVCVEDLGREDSIDDRN